MARKTTAELLAEIAALLPDNTTELITPADVRTCLNNICESFTPAFGVIRGVPGVPVTLTTTPAKLAIFDEVVATSPELVAEPANDRIVAAKAGYYLFNFTSSIAGSNNSDVQIELRRNGSPTLWYALQTTTGAANRAEITLQGYTQAVADGDVFEIYANVLTGTDDATFSANQLLLETIQR